MKVGLILPGNLYFCPYVEIYTRILKENGIEYDIVFWDREGIEETGGIAFTEQFNFNSRATKLIPYLRYCFFVKKVVKERNYSRLIIFGPQLGILLYNFLSKYYKNKFILDYRDLSIEQKLPYIYNKVLSISSLNVISSLGFKKYLPTNKDYILSHNFSIDLVKEFLQKQISITQNNCINVLTIGGIRDYESNISVVKSLANNSKFNLSFVGKSLVSNDIKSFAKHHEISNISFYGYYGKPEEGDFIKNCTIMNIFYPNIPSHTSALSNRFYNSLIYRKPMIVRKNSIQGDFVENYRLGLSIESCENLAEDIELYLTNLNYDLFDQNCIKLLNNFIQDYNIFNTKVIRFLN